MDNKFLNRLYEIHKNDSIDKLQKIIDSATSSREAVQVARQIIAEREGTDNEGITVNNSPNNNHLTLNNNIYNDIHQIAVDIRFMKSVVLFCLIIFIIAIIFIVFSAK